jgi:integrase
MNPCQLVYRNPTKDRECVLSDAEVALLWPKLDPALRLILLTGQRPGEVGALQRDHIVDGWWQMPGKPHGAWPAPRMEATTGSSCRSQRSCWSSFISAAGGERGADAGVVRRTRDRARHAARPAAHLSDLDHPAGLKSRRHG